MEDFIKNIILEKKYFELTSSEKQSIQEWAASEEEFDALKSVLLATQLVAIDNEAQLSPSVKQRLDDRFAAKFAHQNETLWNKFLIFFFPRDTQFFRKPAFQLVMVALVIALIIPFLWQDKPAQYAMNEGDKNLEIEIEKKEAQSTKSTEVQKNDLDNKAISDVISPEVSEKTKLAEPVLSQEYLLDKIESFSSANDMSSKFDLKEMRSQPPVPSPTYDEIAEAEEMVSPSNVSAKKTAAGMNMFAQPKKQVETSETLDLLMALY